MDSDNNKKIVWKRATSKDANSSQSTPNTATSDIPVMDISSRAASHSATKTQNSTSDVQSEITSLKDEINQVLSGTTIPQNDPAQQIVKSKNDMVVDLDASDQDIIDSSKKMDIPAGDLPRTPKANPIEPTTISPDLPGLSDTEKTVVRETTDNSVLDTVAKDNHETLVASLKEDIKSDFQAETEEVTEEGLPKDTGVGQTYYSDLTTAMGSNEPATMSELIRKSRFEEKESKILSPKSKKNIAFIGGSILLLLISIGILMSIFKKEETVKFITEERVQSLVYSNLDTGINTTGLESTRIKQAIRDVIEMKIPTDSINQVYYVQEDGLGNIRRLGVKDIFEKTNNETPEILYDNIENNFTHGIYGTDKNYPFLILKALSYDRALEGLKEWEPSMIDDLATYMDLPPEATDRSLLKPGFEDDLIRNKNVRVARFLPREVDKRGILDFLKLNKNEVETTEINNTQETTNNNTTISEDAIVPQSDNPLTEPLSFVEQARVIAQEFFATNAFAQSTYSVSGTVIDDIGPIPDVNILVTGTTIGAITNDAGNYQIDNVPTGQQNIQFSYLGYQTVTRSVSGPIQNLNISLAPEATQLDEVVINGNSGTSNENTTTTTDPLDSWSFGDTTSGPRDTLSVDINPVCFNQLTGDRIRTNTLEDQQYGFCFKSYLCYKYTCFEGNIDRGPNAQGQPGVTCGEYRAGGDVLHKSESGYNPDIDGTRQSCYQLTDLLSIQNISTAKLCFDENTGQYLPGQIYETEGVVCSVAAQRSETMCLGQNGVIEQPGQSQGQLCFQPFQSGLTGSINSTDGCEDMTYEQLRQKAGAIAYELRTISYYAQILGLSSEDVINIRQAADFLESVAYGGIVESEAYNQAYDVVRGLEYVLDRIDRTRLIPALGSSEAQSIYDRLSQLVYDMKCAFGVESTLGWVDVTIPQGETIFTGQTSPTVDIVQEALTIIGLMDANSPRGTLDLVTQDAIAQFQTANGLQVTGIIDPETLAVLDAIATGQATLFNDNGTIDDYFIVTNGIASSNQEQLIGLSSYNEYAQNLQIILYAQGYEITSLNGLFNKETCSALQEFQDDQGLEISNDIDCIPGADTLETLNQIILDNNYLGSGYYLNPQGFLTGSGTLNGTFGPGVVDFGVNEADADSLREGDIVLMYMFLDEQTILIARDEVVIDEIVKRRALSDIFK